MKKPKQTHEWCEDCEVKPATRIYMDNDGNGIMLCQRCLDVRLLRDSIKADDSGTQCFTGEDL